MALHVTVIPCLSDNYGYLIHDDEAGVSALIDAPEAAPLRRAIEAAGRGLDLILLTHHHADHVQAAAELARAYGARIAGPADEADKMPPLDLHLRDGDVVAVGAQPARVMAVPGHTLGHIAYHFPDAEVAFTADSLMALGCGRVFEGTHLMMWESLSKLAALPPRTRIYSGHNYGAANGRFALTIEPDNAALRDRVARIAALDAEGAPIVPATLEEELATNPFLRASVPAVKAAVGLPDADDAAVFAEIRRRKDAF